MFGLPRTFAKQCILQQGCLIHDRSQFNQLLGQTDKGVYFVPYDQPEGVLITDEIEALSKPAGHFFLLYKPLTVEYVINGQVKSYPLPDFPQIECNRMMKPGMVEDDYDSGNDADDEM